MKQDLKIAAITLHRRGFTYSEILKEVPVAKSTLSLWLWSAQLAKRRHQTLTEMKRLAGLQGGAARKKERIERMHMIFEAAREEVATLSKRELWLIGITLYWAEGVKEKGYRISNPVTFSNSDPQMIMLFLRWIEICLRIPREKVYFYLPLHENYRDNVEEYCSFWNQLIGIRYNSVQNVYVKKHNSSSKRKNVDSTYHGPLVVKIRNSVNLNRKISGWIEGICLHCPVV